jgi:hypothetical protein
MLFVLEAMEAAKLRDTTVDLHGLSWLLLEEVEVEQRVVENFISTVLPLKALCGSSARAWEMGSSAARVVLAVSLRAATSHLVWAIAITRLRCAPHARRDHGMW